MCTASLYIDEISTFIFLKTTRCRPPQGTSVWDYSGINRGASYKSSCIVLISAVWCVNGVPNSIAGPRNLFKNNSCFRCCARLCIRKESLNCRDFPMQFGVLTLLDIHCKVASLRPPSNTAGQQIVCSLRPFRHSAKQSSVCGLPNHTNVRGRRTFCNRCLTITQTIMKTLLKLSELTETQCLLSILFLCSTSPDKLADLKKLQHASVRIAQLWAHRAACRYPAQRSPVKLTVPWQAAYNRAVK